MRRTILSALALVLACAFAAEARADSPYKVAGTTWTTLVRGDKGDIQVERWEFDKSGGFHISVTAVGDKVVSQVSGTFTLQGDVLVTKAEGKELRFTIVSQDDKVMVLRIGAIELRYARVE